MEDSLTIGTTSEFESVRVSDFDQDVWLHLSVRHGTCHVTLTKEQANQLIMALQTVVAVLEEA